jgi:predicted XRE-type DNA-binding protein
VPNKTFQQLGNGKGRYVFVDTPEEAKEKFVKQAIATTFTKHQKKNIRAMTKAEIDELLIAICQKLGIADEAGVIK